MNVAMSNLDDFKKQLLNPNKGFNVKPNTVNKIAKDIVISIVSDYTGCGHIRNILPSIYLNAIFSRNGLRVINTPIPIYDQNILKRTRAIFFQRTMGPSSTDMISYFKEIQKQYKFKMIYDIDDFIWEGDDNGEEIPEYNFGKPGITKEVRLSSIENMKLMDTVCVSTQFLKEYLITRGIEEKNIKVLHNTLPGFLWGSDKKQHITDKIKKPKVLWSASPTHWHNEHKLKGDMENAWYDWIIKSVKEDKIDYVQMGGLPWFFEEIKDKITVYNWVDSLHYPQVVRSINADFGIAPLVPNYFNYSKSAIKYQEYCMVGTVGIGTVFTNGKPSPYDINITTAPDNITVDGIDKMIDTLCDPENYNNILDLQYKQLIDNAWITESKEYINTITSLL